MWGEGGGAVIPTDFNLGKAVKNLRKWLDPVRYVFLEDVARASLYMLKTKGTNFSKPLRSPNLRKVALVP